MAGAAESTGAMIKATLRRIESANQGTFGVLSVENDTEVTFFYTLELPWRENRPNISCIPVGEYKCERTYSHRFKKPLFLVGNVPGRAGIRIHPANFAGDAARGLRSQLNGCIAIGEKLGTIDGQKAILLSKPAVRRFEALTLGQPFILEIL